MKRRAPFPCPSGTRRNCVDLTGGQQCLGYKKHPGDEVSSPGCFVYDSNCTEAQKPPTDLQQFFVDFSDPLGHRRVR